MARIERIIDTDRGTVRFAIELRLDMRPDLAADAVYEHVLRGLEALVPPLDTTEAS